jgi:hypothetical protein
VHFGPVPRATRRRLRNRMRLSDALVVPIRNDPTVEDMDSSSGYVEHSPETWSRRDGSANDCMDVNLLPEVFGKERLARAV